MKSRGRKKVLYPEAEIKNIVKQYLQLEHSVGKIKYKSVFLFAKQLYQSEQIPYELSEDFWRKPERQGTQIIDELNKIMFTTTKSDNDNFEVISTSDIINQYSTDTSSIKKRIITSLKVNEYGYRNLIKKYKKILNKEKQYQDEIKMWKEKYEDALSKSRIYEEVLFQWANASSSRDIKLINTITTGKTRSKVVEQLFKEMFNEEPNAPYQNINKDDENKNNIIELVPKSNTLIEDLDL